MIYPTNLKRVILFFILLSAVFFCEAQSALQKDSMIQSLLKNHVTTEDQGIQLINSGNFESANSFLTKEISSNESNASSLSFSK